MQDDKKKGTVEVALREEKQTSWFQIEASTWDAYSYITNQKAMQDG